MKPLRWERKGGDGEEGGGQTWAWKRLRWHQACSPCLAAQPPRIVPTPAVSITTAAQPGRDSLVDVGNSQQHRRAAQPPVPEVPHAAARRHERGAPHESRELQCTRGGMVCTVAEAESRPPPFRWLLLRERATFVCGEHGHLGGELRAARGAANSCCRLTPPAASRSAPVQPRSPHEHPTPTHPPTHPPAPGKMMRAASPRSRWVPNRVFQPPARTRHANIRRRPPVLPPVLLPALPPALPPVFAAGAAQTPRRHLSAVPSAPAPGQVPA